MNTRVLERDLRLLSARYRIDVAKNYRFFIVREFRLPPGYNRASIDVWTEAPEDYPESSPGVFPSRVFVPVGLRFRGRNIEDYHENVGPRGWAWWCYREIKWDPRCDNLITFFEMLRSDMTKSQ